MYVKLTGGETIHLDEKSEIRFGDDNEIAWNNPVVYVYLDYKRIHEWDLEDVVSITHNNDE